ncbi:MAG: hypothetical protein EP305_10510 [Bacteroidetes bacterium]|nr:MAG: hypothetical protein EP305_10510 [Bacteroidota bacterium]
MKNNICPKCSSTQIFTDSKSTKRGERSSVAISSWSMFFVDVYVCLNCGYLEEYIATDQLNDFKKMEKLKENWKKV